MAETVITLSTLLGPALSTLRDFAATHESGRGFLHIPGVMAGVPTKYCLNTRHGIGRANGVLVGCDVSQLCEAILSEEFCTLVSDTGDAVTIDIQTAQLTGEGVWATFEVIERAAS